MFVDWVAEVFEKCPLLSGAEDSRHAVMSLTEIAERKNALATAATGRK